MSTRKPGRPAGGQAVTPETILARALDLLAEKGEKALTMRSLARAAGVNPMTIYYHFGDREGLIRAVADHAYADITVPKSGDVKQRLSQLMATYHWRVQQYPELTLLIFRMPSLFPDQARRLSREVLTLFSELGIGQELASLWLNILVDFTHGAAIATAMNSTLQKDMAGTGDYERSLNELLDRLIVI